MTEEKTSGSNFLVELSPREVFQRTDRYMLDRGFSVGLNRTVNSAVYTLYREKRLLGRLLRMSPDFYRVRLSTREEEGGLTYLTVKISQKGHWPDVRPEIEQWITQALGGTSSSPENPLL